MTNPFEDETGVFHVLVNEEGQHSLCPAFKRCRRAGPLLTSPTPAPPAGVHQSELDGHAAEEPDRTDGKKGRGQEAELSRDEGDDWPRWRVVQRVTMERISSGAPFSKCSMKS